MSLHEQMSPNCGLVIIIIFYSSSPNLLSSLPLYGVGLTLSGPLHILALGNLRAMLTCAGVLNQSCPEVARVGLLELCSRVYDVMRSPSKCMLS